MLSLVAMALLPAGAARAATTDPAPLLNQAALESPGLYQATVAQQNALNDLAATAVKNTIADHGLAAGDGAAAQTWGRNAAEAELYALLVAAIGASKPSADQANAAAWMQQVVTRQETAAADAAGLEYAKWAGISPSSYQNELNTDPTAAALQSWLQNTKIDCGGTLVSPPCPYAGGAANTLLKTPASTSNEGFCVYVPPAPYTVTAYEASIYNSSTASSLCYQGSGLLCSYSCGAPTPTSQQFVAWGLADANSQFNTPGWTSAANGIGEAASFGIAVGGAAIASGGTAAALGTTALSGLLFEPLLVGGVVEGVADTTTIASALVPFGGVSGETFAMGVTQGSAAAMEITSGIAAADIAGTVGIVLSAIALGVLQAISVFSSAAVPGQLAQLITAAPNGNPDLAAMLQSQQSATEIYSLFVGATLPLPGRRTTAGQLSICDVPVCLNAPPIPPPANSDPTFTIAANGSQQQQVVDRLTWLDGASQTRNSAYITGHWFVTTQTSSTTQTPSLTVQTLAIHYTDWAGHEQMAWLTGDASSGYEFITYRPQTKTPAEPQTCVADGLCSKTKSIEYIDPTRGDYTASISFGHTALSPVAASAVYRGRPTFTATLQTQTGTPLANRTVAFSLATDTPSPMAMGTAETNSQGVATLTPAANLASYYYPLPNGSYEGLVTASFAGDATHLASSATGDLTVTPAPQSITLQTAPPPSAVYGTGFSVGATASSGLPVTYAGSGACSNSGSRFTMTSGTGQCTVTISQSGKSTGDVSLCALGFGAGHVCIYEPDTLYQPASAKRSVTAARAPQTISFDLSGLTSKTYGDSVSLSVYASASSQLPVSLYTDSPSTCTVSTATVHLVGAGPCVLVATQAGDSDYLAALPVEQRFTVARASLQVAADNASMTYGGPVPAFGATVRGLVNGDTFAGLGGTCTASVGGAPVTPATGAGTYPGAIACSDVSTLNYIVTYAAGTLRIQPAPLAVTAQDQSVQYSDLLPPLSTTVTGFVLGQDQSLLSGSDACTTGADVTAAGQVLSPAGAYPIDCSGNLSAPNYTVRYVPGTLTVNRENTVVTLGQRNPHAVAVATSGPDQGGAPALTLLGRVTAAADGHYGDISKAVPLTLDLVPVGPGQSITAACSITRIQPGTATSPGFEDASCQLAPGTPVEVYAVVLSVGGLYYEGSGQGVLTVYDPSAGGSSGAATITNPRTGATAHVGYSVSYLKNGKMVQGKFSYTSHDGAGNVVHTLQGDATSTLAIAPAGAAYPKTAVVTGRATLDGVGGYTYILTGVDRDGPDATGAGDRIGLEVFDASGHPVPALTFAPVPLASGDVLAGS